MSTKKSPIPNSVRAERTRLALKTAARALFVDKGFADTGTPEIVKAAQVTRGALYHHYGDKRDLFADVIEDEFAQLAQEIESKSTQTTTALDALKDGGDAFISSMATRSRTRLVLIEAPTVLGRDTLVEIEDRHTRRSLREGLQSAMEAGEIVDLPLDELLEITSALFDSAALSVETGHSIDKVKRVVHQLIDGLSLDRTA